MSQKKSNYRVDVSSVFTSSSDEDSPVKSGNGKNIKTISSKKKVQSIPSDVFSSDSSIISEDDVIPNHVISEDESNKVISDDEEDNDYVVSEDEGPSRRKVYNKSKVSGVSGSLKSSPVISQDESDQEISNDEEDNDYVVSEDEGPSRRKVYNKSKVTGVSGSLKSSPVISRDESDQEISDDEEDNNYVESEDDGSPRRKVYHKSKVIPMSNSSKSSSPVISEDDVKTSKGNSFNKPNDKLTLKSSGREKSRQTFEEPERKYGSSSAQELIVLSDEDNNQSQIAQSAKHGSLHPANLTPERQIELKNAKRFLEVELAKESATLQNLQTTTKNIQFSTLPDRGAKLRSSIEKQVTKIKELNERMNYVSANIVDKTPVVPSYMEPTKGDLKIPNIVDLTKDNTDLSEMGKRALATHQAQQSQTVQTLERLHKFLKADTEEEASDPSALKVPLLPHQRTALAWLLRRESAVPPGGIVADDMGLGKTLTMISLILKDIELSITNKNDSSDDGDSPPRIRHKLFDGNTLVICPSSVLGQWGTEISSKVKSGNLSVYTHHGTKRESRSQRLARFDVVITTYTIVQNDNKEEPGPLYGVHWKRVILDEAHVIRNHKSKTAQAVFALRARRRWALTGTPIHNKQEDFFSLLKFLRCKPFNDIVIWKKMVECRAEAGIQRLHLLTKSLLLRRTKEDIKKTGGLQNLLPKECTTIQVKLDPEEFKVYDKISHFSSTLLAQYIEERAEKEDLMREGLDIKRKGLSNPFADHPELGKLYNDMLSIKGGVKTHHILVLLLRLRQMCCHPSLITSFIDKQELKDEGVEDEEGNDAGLIEQMMNLSLAANADAENPSAKLMTSDLPVFRKDRCSSKIREITNCINEIMEKGSDKIIIVSQWTSVLQIIKSFLNVKSVSLNGTIPVKDRIGIIEDFNNNTHGPKVLLLSLTAGGTGLNLVGANHLLLVDIHWNPQLETQACDRIYRIGQTKTVHIYKFLCVDTIEERILKLQNHKLELAKGVLTGSAKIQSSKLTLHDLKLLFDIKH